MKGWAEFYKERLGTSCKVSQVVPNGISDRDTPVTESVPAFQRRVDRMGINQVLIAPRAQWQNPFAECAIGFIRPGRLDHFIVLNERFCVGWCCRSWASTSSSAEATAQIKSWKSRGTYPRCQRAFQSFQSRERQWSDQQHRKSRPTDGGFAISSHHLPPLTPWPP